MNDGETKKAAAKASIVPKRKRRGTKGDVELRPVTVRFTTAGYETLSDLARQKGVSLAEIVRVAAAGNLAEYFGTLRFMDMEQGDEIKKQVTALLDVVSQIQVELNRIGVNYNQEIQLKQYERQLIANGYSDRRLVNLLANERMKMEHVGLSPDVVTDLIARYEEATKEVGDALCRILM